MYTAANEMTMANRGEKDVAIRTRGMRLLAQDAGD